MVPVTLPEPTTLSAEAALEIMDKLSQKRYQCSAREFLQRWDAGEFRGDDSRQAAEIASLIPFVR